MYRVVFSKDAQTDLKRLAKSDKSCLKKVASLIEELELHPQSGTGKPEQLKGDKSGLWSRRINRKHRRVYKIEDEQVSVLVLSAYGHYE